MLRIIFVLALGLLAAQADAGSRVWESSIPRLVSNSTSGSGIGRRWIRIQPRDGPMGERVWPKKTITYCLIYSDDATKKKLEGMVKLGKEVWKDLGKDFKYVDKTGKAACTEDRANILHIQYNNRGYLATSNGLRYIDLNHNRDNPDDAYEGPNMHLSDKEGIGHLDLRANVGHEFGHAWGLLHEHQNPNFWRTSEKHKQPEPADDGLYWDIPYSGDTFHTEMFDCTAIKGYDEAVTRARAKQAEDEAAFRMKGMTDYEIAMCTDRSIAQYLKFAAMEWLPYQNKVAFDAGKEVDLGSIMIYPSGAGGSGYADDTGVDQRSPILRLMGGQKIPRNLGPSTGDITAIQALYGASARPLKQLHGDKDSSWRNLFKKKKAGGGSDSCPAGSKKRRATK